MIRPLIVFTFAIILQSATAIAQSPTPTPATRRPTLDQFGLSNGVFASNGSTSSPADGTTLKTQYVDQGTYDILIAVVEKSEFLGAELSRVLNDKVDISPTSKFRKYFEHNLEGLFNVSAVQRSGQFGGAGIKSDELSNLLQQNEKTIFEILAVLNTDAEEYARYSKEIRSASEKYGVPLLKTPVDGMLLDKPALLKAMMARMNSNYARVKKSMVVSK